MATTAADLINDALQAIVQYSPADTVDANDSALALRTLNRMLDSWSAERIMVPVIKTDNFALVAAQANYATTLLSARPIALEPACYVKDGNGVQYPLQTMSRAQYNGIAYPAAPGIPSRIFLDPGVAAGTMYFYTTPIGGLTAYITYVSPLTTFAATSDVVTLPPGYERAIVNNLALDLAPYFNAEIPQSLAVIAGDSKMAIAQVNAFNMNRELSVAQAPLGWQSPAGFNWYSGEPT